MSESNGVDPENSARSPVGGKCDHFALTLGEDELPEVLRRVARTIEGIERFRLLSMTVTNCDEEATAAVYYYQQSWSESVDLGET